MISRTQIDAIQQMNIGDCLENEPLYKHTTYKVGGPCSLYVKVKDVESLQKLMNYIRQEDLPYFVIGNGSNLLFSDKMYEGIIISLNECFKTIAINGSQIKADAGVSVIYLANEACKCGLSGLEFAGGIPASVGGAIYMNAGAYLSEFSAVVEAVTILDENGYIRTLDKNEMKFGYRHSILQENKDWIVLSCQLNLISKDVNEIKELMDKRKEKRMSTQPWNQPSAGSVFRNPEEMPAWKCIDMCGLRGKEIGGAQISPKHSNFIVNNGYASAKDILSLIQLAQKEVKEQLNIVLHTEVRLINW